MGLWPMSPMYRRGSNESVTTENDLSASRHDAWHDAVLRSTRSGLKQTLRAGKVNGAGAACSSFRYGSGPARPPAPRGRGGQSDADGIRSGQMGRWTFLRQARPEPRAATI